MISTEILRTHLGGISEGDSDEAVLEQIEAWAHPWVEGQTNRSFREAALLVEIYDGNGEASLELRSPVTSGTPTVEIRSHGTWSTLSSEVWNIERNERLRGADGLGLRSFLTLEGMKWPWGERNIRVSYPGGYDEGGEPPEIRFLVAELTAYWFRERLNSSPTSLSPMERKKVGAVPAHCLAILQRWSRIERSPQPRLVKA